MLAVATFANIKIRYDTKTPQFTIFGTRVTCLFYSNYLQDIRCRVVNFIIKYVLKYIFSKKMLYVRKILPKYNSQTNSQNIHT